MNKKLGKTLKYGISILVAAILLYFSFREVSWADFITSLKACRWEFVVLSMFFGLLTFWLRGLRWRELLLPIDASTSRLTCFDAINISYLVNLVLPRVGEVVRCGYITVHSQKDPDAPEGENRKLASFDKVLGTAAVERIFDIMALLLIMAVFLGLSWGRFGGFFAERVFEPMAGGVDFGKIAVMAAIILGVVCFFVCAILFADKWKPFAAIKRFCKGLWQGAVACLRMKGAWKPVALTLGIWAAYWFMCASILWAVQGISPNEVSAEMASVVDKLAELNLTDAMFLMLVGGLSSLVPVPGGFGAFHFLVSSALSVVYGIPSQFGMIFATLSHESQAINQAFWGGVSYGIETIRLRGGKRQELQRNPKGETDA